MHYLGNMILVFMLVVIIKKIWQLFRIVLWRPYVLTKFFEKQGITGPRYELLHGNLKEIKVTKKAARGKILDINSNDDITSRILPHYHKWSAEYGDTMLYWFGMIPRVIIADPELAKQILSNKFGFYVKTIGRPTILKLTGKGLALVEGTDWVRHRRVLNPAFSIDKLKIMITKMAECTVSMLEEWKDKAAADKDQLRKIEMSGNFQRLTADIIAYTSFGSSYLQGKEAFKAQKELQILTASTLADIYIPGSQYLPTPTNIKLWKLDRRVKNSLGSIIKSRLKAGPGPDGCYGDDLLGLMIGSAVYRSTEKIKTSPRLSMDEIMEECKMFFFAGHETTSNLLTWTILLLSIHQDWQEKLREEVFNECGTQIPDADMLAKLKLVNMTLLEALRLYPPAIMLIRKASEDMKLGNLMIPKDTCLSIPIIKIQRSKEYWGEDANEFNPMRFVNGMSKAAKHPNALLAFSIGPRACIGQNFAMLEAKTVLTLILQRFSLSLSPDYKHAPIDCFTLQPQFGMPVYVKPLHV